MGSPPCGVCCIATTRCEALMKRLWDKRVLWFVRMEATARPSVPPAFDRFFTDPQCAQPLSPGCFEKLPMATKTQLDGETFLCKPAKSSLVIRRLQVPHAGIPSTRVLTRACPRVLSAQPCALTSPVRIRFVRLTLRCYASPLAARPSRNCTSQT